MSTSDDRCPARCLPDFALLGKVERLANDQAAIFHQQLIINTVPKIGEAQACSLPSIPLGQEMTKPDESQRSHRDGAPKGGMTSVRLGTVAPLPRSDPAFLFPQSNNHQPKHTPRKIDRTRSRAAACHTTVGKPTWALSESRLGGFPASSRGIC